MDTVDILTLVLSGLAIIGTIFSLFIGHSLSQKRDFENRKNEIRIQYLIDAYRKIEDASNREEPNDKRLLQLESAIADIQLFGSEKQVRLALKIAEDMARTKSAGTLELLQEFRASLREELGVPQVEIGKWSFLRIRFNTNE